MTTMLMTIHANNIFQIMDGIIIQLNKTKKMFIIMILTIMIIPPITFAVTFALLGPPFPFHDRGPPDRFGPGFNLAFGIARIVPFLISVIWLGIGVWQWFVFSKWSKKYDRYKELQKKIDEKLDYDNNDVGKR
jgi:Na+-driven multidrug efflux pump